MSDGWHIYDCSEGRDPKLLKTITTPAQARKNAFYYPSVTGVLGLLPNTFMARWRGRKLAELRAANPDHDIDELEEMAWGMRTCPETGGTITSSEFGTKAHATIEDYFTTDAIGSLAKHPYWPAVSETVSYLPDNFTFHHAEKILVDHDLRIAGTVDYIGTDKDDKWMLGDFKFRDVKNEKANFFPKDLAQLAIEGEMWKETMNLDYSPDIYSIVVDCNTGKCYPKKWSEKMRRKGIKRAQTASYIYWNRDDYGWLDGQ